MKKLYSILFRGQDMPTIIELDGEQLQLLRQGKFIMARKYNTRSHQYSDFGFSIEVVQTLTESDYQIAQKED